MEHTVNLKIAIWNANGLCQHGLELTNFIKLHDLDLVLISETHYTNRSYLRIPNYTIHHTNHPDGTAHGGTAVIIKNSIKHNVMNKFQTPHIQATSVNIEDRRGSLTISAIYCPPRYTIKEEQFQDFFATLGNRFLAGGDYNAKHQQWGSRLATTKGRELLKCIANNNLKHVSTGKPTYWPTDKNKIPDVIDFCVMKGIPNENVSAEQNLDLSSDHTPIMVTISSEVILKQKPLTITSKKTDWDLFRILIEDKLQTKIPLKTADDIDDAVEALTRTIQQAAWNSTPIHNGMNKKQQNCTDIIREAVANKRKIRKIWMSTKSPRDKERFNSAAKNLKEMIQKQKNNEIEKYLCNLTATDATEYSLWKATSKIRRTQENIPPIRKTDGSWARDDAEKAKTFAEHLSKVFQPHPTQLTTENDEIQQFLESPYQLDSPIKAVTTEEIKDMIRKNLSPKKAPGYDLITGAIIKQLPEKALKMLRIIYNAIMRVGHFPSQWKVGQIIMIAKPGKPPEEVTSYRPISLLPILSKLFEKLFLKRLNPIIDTKKLIPEHQFGFRSKHATVEQVHRIVEKINKAFEMKKYCSTAYLDITQAFDKVWHEGLLFKLKMKLPHCFYQVLKSYLTERYYQVKHHKEVTELYPIQAGVPQGSVLGPVLYLLFTADIPTTADFTATYADDTALMAVHEDPAIASRNLQKFLNDLLTWQKKWRINTNESKSVHVTYTLRTKTCPPVTLNGRQIPQAEDAKYLGLHLDRRLTWKKHIFTKRKQLGIKFSRLYWLLGRRSRLSLENKLLIYKAILKPVWMYGVQLWGTASNSNIEILQRFQSKTLRIITDAPWYTSNDIIHQDLHMCSVREVVKCASEKYLSRLERHPNTLAMNLLDNSNTTYRLKRYKPLDLPNRI